MDDWGFEPLEPWLRARERMPVGPLFCVINGRSWGRPWRASAAQIIETVHARRPPVVPASVGLLLPLAR